MKTITIKGGSMPIQQDASSVFTPFCMVVISWPELRSALDQREELLKENHPVEQIEIVVEVPQIGGTLYGHKCRLKVKDAAD